jgi:hypothetical protein
MGCDGGTLIHVTFGDGGIENAHQMEWGCQKANEVPKSKCGAKEQMWCQKANGAPKGKWGTKRRMGCQKANGVLKNGVPKSGWGAK